MSIVAKFGGTSMAAVESIQKVLQIIATLSTCRVVVVSAPGRRFEGDAKVTDLLLRGEVGEVISRFQVIAQQFGVQLDLSGLKSLGAESEQKLLASRGEYYSSQLLAAVLGSEWTWVDAAEVMRFNEDGSFNEVASYELIRCAARGKRVVIGGFYGATAGGRVVTFSRGGSDTTGAHAAAAIGAEVYHNYTDVQGVFAEDPNINPLAEHFGEVCAQAFIEMNARVVNPDAVWAASARGIPIRVLSTFVPNGRSTLIVPCAEHRIAA